MSAYRYPDGSVEVSVTVTVPAAIAKQGRAATLAHVSQSCFDKADVMLDRIQECTWPTCGQCGRDYTPGADHSVCEERYRQMLYGAGFTP